MKNSSKAIAATLVLTSVFGGYYFIKAKDVDSAAVLSVKEYTIQRGDLQLATRATGTVQPENRLEIKPPIAGRVEKVVVNEGDRVRKGQILAWMSSTERAAVLDAARAKGPEEVARWEELYRSTPVVAPINGTIIAREVEPGQSFLSSDSILVLSDRLTVKAQVDETDLALVKVGLEATVSLDAYAKQPIKAKVARIAFEAKTVNNVTMYEVDVTPTNTPEFMRSGMTASVTFRTHFRENVVLIANEAIVSENGKSFARVKAATGETKVELSLGLSDGKQSEVLSGVVEGDLVLAPRLGAAKSEQSKNPFVPTRPGPNRSGNRSRSSP